MLISPRPVGLFTEPLASRASFLDARVITTKRKPTALAILAALTLVIVSLPVQVYATTCSASQSPAWQICGPIQSPTGLNVQPSVIQANDGTLKMAWTARPLTSYIILYASGSWNGTAWSWGAGASPTTQGGINQNPALAQLPNGTIYLFWAYKAATSRHFQLNYLTNNGAGFSKTYTPVPLANPTGLNDTFPTATVGRDGTLWLAWSRDNTTLSGTSHVMRQLWYETLAPGAARFSTEQPLSTATDANWNFQPTILAGKDSVVRLAFSRGQAASGIYDIFYITYNGSIWSSPIPLTSQTTTQDSDPSLTQDRNGTIWIFWGRNELVGPSDTVYVIYTRSSTNNGSTWTSETALTPATCGGSGCIDSEYPAAVQSTTDKNIWVFYSTDPSTTFVIYALKTTQPISPVHDVAILYFSPNVTNAVFAGGFYDPYTPTGSPIYQSATVRILVVFKNLGDFSETVTLTLTATNTTSYRIGVQHLQIGPGVQLPTYFDFNTTGVKPARYGLNGNASIPVVSLGNKQDGLLSGSNMFHLIPRGDVDRSGGDTITDVSIVFYDYGFTCYTPSTCSPRYTAAIYGDLNGNGIIDIIDIGVVLYNFGIVT